jgi:hypothetical protein
MANSATLVDKISADFGGLSPVYEYEVDIDTVDTDLTVHTPSGNDEMNIKKAVYVVGVWLSEGTAANVTLISGSNTKSQTFELAANQGLSGLTSKGFYFATKSGEALKIRSSAIISSTVGNNLVIRVVEGEKFRG